jgi:hypothetical protein
MTITIFNESDLAFPPSCTPKTAVLTVYGVDLKTISDFRQHHSQIGDRHPQHFSHSSQVNP